MAELERRSCAGACISKRGICLLQSYSQTHAKRQDVPLRYVASAAAGGASGRWGPAQRRVGARPKGETAVGLSRSGALSWPAISLGARARVGLVCWGSVCSDGGRFASKAGEVEFSHHRRLLAAGAIRS